MAFGNGKATAAAAHLDIHESNVSRMCSGEKSVAVRHFLTLFEGCPEAFIAFARPLCKELGLAPPMLLGGPERADIEEDAVDFLQSEELLWRLFCEHEEKTRGWSAEQVMGALREEGSDK